MHDKYYLDKLYPLQDKVLRIVESINSKFYLTGGTVLSRAYLHHRYSDDLDFFLNRENDFLKEVDKILIELKKSFEVKVPVREEAYVLVFVNEKEISLKIDFVNDVGFHVGEIVNHPFFKRVDSWQNILSNKITALTRSEGKDIADILELSKKYSFNWMEVINQALNKDTWVEEVRVSQAIHDFPIEKLERVKWIYTLDSNQAITDLKIIAKDILLGTDNSLFKK